MGVAPMRMEKHGRDARVTWTEVQVEQVGARLMGAVIAAMAAAGVCAENLLDNPSFEKADGEMIADWAWSGGAAQAVCDSDAAQARSGKRSVCLKNPSACAPNVFGSLTQTVRVSPNQRYTLSCYVKTAGGGTAWIGGGRRWEHRFVLPSKTEGWQRVAGSFTTAPGEDRFTVRINTDSVTDGLWVDDVMLEAGGAATPFLYEPPLAAGESRLTLSPFDPGENLAPNASFEQAAEGCPAGWRWDPRNTDATLIVDAGESHTGKASVRLANGTAFGAHVFGTLYLAKAVPVKPGTRYTLSAFVKSGAVSPGVWIGGGEGWKVRRMLPATRGRWERVSLTFVTGEQERDFTLRVVTDRPVPAVLLDDLSLREGDRPVPAALEGVAAADHVDLSAAPPPAVEIGGRALGTRWAPQRWPVEAWSFCEDVFSAEGVVTVADASQPSRVAFSLAGDGGTVLASREAALEAGPRAFFVTLRASLGPAAPDTLTLTARLLRDGRTLATHTGKVNLVTRERVQGRLSAAAGSRDRLRPQVEALERCGLGAASRVTLTVLDNFIPWAQEDLAKGTVDRAWDAACLLDQMGAREARRAEEILGGRATDFPVPRYATGKLEVSRAQTVGNRRAADGTVARGPVLFTGYGHFGQVKRDIERLPGYGCNIFQVEFGPSAVLPDESRTSDRAISEFLALCDRAAQANVAVNLLLSPHYFPQWALDKWPHLKECQGGFFKYCVHDPAARAVIEKSLRHVIPRIKGHPALHSVCLSNEPICVDLSRCRVTAKAWPAWLERRHGTIATLNERWGTAYTNFAAIPVPAPEIVAAPACLDFIRYNQESFAEFHGWMAGVVRALAPELPVHAKIMMGAHFQKTLHGMWSVDPERFAALSQYNGNDAYNMLDKEGSRWANGWRHCQAGYDFQRSMADLPVFNSENHLIVDRDLDVIPPAHLYGALWQNAIHGQSATTLWIWERCDDYAGDASGSILHRPDCVEAVGRCALDLSRLAGEVAALQNLEPAVCLLWSDASLVLGGDHGDQAGLAYEAANFLGQPLGFVTEAKLAAVARTGALPRPLARAKVLLLPSVTHLPDDAREGLMQLRAAGLRIVALGRLPGKNDYGQPRDPGALETLPPAADSEALFGHLQEAAGAWRLPESLRLSDASGSAAFGVEIRSAPFRGGVVASVCNHLRAPKTVTLEGASGATLVNLLTGDVLGPTFTAQPMTPLLIRAVAPEAEKEK